MARTENAAKNAAWQIVFSIVIIVLNLLNRYCFMNFLGESYLGLNDLFASVLGMLSFVDLGLANCFTFCLYRPLAQNDEKYLKILLKTFRRVFWFIMLAIAILGVMLLPFLRLLISGGDAIGDKALYTGYILSLVEVICSYYCTYKVCFVAAAQKDYQLMPFRIVGTVSTTVLKFLVLLLTKNYELYILTGVLITILQQIAISRFIQWKYPVIRSLRVEGKISEADRASIRRNLWGILMGKFAGISVYQTDSILISSGLNVSTLGRVSNYRALKDNVFSIISRIQQAAVASMGDLMATATKKKQLDVFYTYLTISEILTGFAVCELSTLMTPFIALLFGTEHTVDIATVLLICVAAGISYHTYALNILPTAGGRYELGIYISFVEGAVNLLVSIVAMRVMGLKGVFVGTLVSQLCVFILRPISVFPKMFDMSPVYYYKRSLLSFATAGVFTTAGILASEKILHTQLTWTRFFLLAIGTSIIFIVGYTLLWKRDRYFQDAFVKVKQILGLVKARHKNSNCE